jgi:hypothetical protein
VGFIERIESLRYLVFMSMIIICFAGNPDPCFSQSPGFVHAAFDSVLHQYVEDGLVDYAALVSDRGALHRYLETLINLDPEEFETWDSDAKKAFWINAYNAITIEGILRHYPIRGGSVQGFPFPKNSIRQIRGFWKTVFVPVMGLEISLDQIEHDILRKEFNDPRVHFVLVCASLGCPILESRAFLPDNLNARLHQATLRFVRDPEYVALDLDTRIINLSRIFKWYAEDFYAIEPVETHPRLKVEEKNIIGFLKQYLPDADTKLLNTREWRIRYTKYDWTLNEK